MHLSVTYYYYSCYRFTTNPNSFLITPLSQPASQPLPCLCLLPCPKKTPKKKVYFLLVSFLWCFCFSFALNESISLSLSLSWVRISSHFFPSKNPTGVRISSHFFPPQNPTWVRISCHFFPSQNPTGVRISSISSLLKTPLEWELVVISSLLKPHWSEWVSVWKPCPFEPPLFLLCVWRRKCTEVFLFWGLFLELSVPDCTFQICTFYYITGVTPLLCSALLWSALICCCWYYKCPLLLPDKLISPYNNQFPTIYTLHVCPHLFL